MSAKYTFKLRNIDLHKVHAMYGFIISNPKVTYLEDLDSFKSISFLDEAKITRNCDVSMIDLYTQKTPSGNGSNCFWCKHPFEGNALGCPVSYISKQLTKSYHSCINNKQYIIKETLSTKKMQEICGDILGPVYVTYGVFCSFNCCMAWILDNKHDKLYDMSKTMLLKLYKDITGEITTSIKPAGHWTKLDCYTGDVSIEDFRKDFSRVSYYDYGNVVFIPTGKLYEKAINFSI